MNYNRTKQWRKREIKILTEPVVAGLRSDCFGAVTEQIVLDVLLHFWLESGDAEEKAERPKSFCGSNQISEDMV